MAKQQQQHQKDRFLCRYDEAPIHLSVTTESSLSVASLEDSIEARLVEDDPAAVVFLPVHDVAWLHCQQRRRTKNSKSPKVASITGLVEDFGDDDDDGTNGTATVVQLRRRTTIIPAENTSSHAAPSCTCPVPRSDWTVPKKPMPNEEEAQEQLSKDTNIGTGDAACRIIVTEWFDLAHTTFPTNAGIVHTLRSLLGAHHAVSPWVETGEKTSDSPECVILQFTDCAPPLLCSFRVSDACPSWCLYSKVQIISSSSSNTSTSTRCELLVYRRLPPRERLSRTHPLTKEPAASAAATSGLSSSSLWETVLTPPNDEDDTFEISYRLTAPPYVDCLQEFPMLQALLEPTAQSILRQEAMKIPQWTAWPEQQHYATGEGGAIPWHVFPLLHTFPAHDVSKRSWIVDTCRAAPRTVQLLRDTCGDALRTALFSRLEPNSVLEAHTGWADLANHVFRVHVPIDVPAANAASDLNGSNSNKHGSTNNNGLCGTWVDGCVETHSPDALLAFDDSKNHRAFNYHASASRVVLILDVARPSHWPRGTATGGHSDELDAFIQQFAAPK